MGIRNLAIVGTHRDYAADVYDESWGSDPSTVTDCASPWDAAVCYFKSMFENSAGIIRRQSIVVWPVDEDRSSAKIFEAWAEVGPSDELGEYEVVFEAVERDI
jgi:hypothetical protein